MKIIRIALKDLLQAARDGKGLLILIVMPLVLIAILGSALSSQFTPSRGVQKFELGFINHDGKMIGDAVEAFLTAEGLSDLFTVVVMDETLARESVSKGKLAAAIIIPKGASDAFLAGQAVEFELLKDAGRLMGPTVAQSVLQSIADSLGASQLVVRQAIGSIPADQLYTLGESVAYELQKLAPDVRVELSQHQAVITSFQYYTAGIAVMFLLYAGMFGLQSVIEERRLLTYQRMLAAPVWAGSFVMGKFMGIVAVSFSQFMVLMIGTRFIYGVRWGNRPWEAIMVALALGIAISGLALMASALAKDEKTVMSIWPIGVQICSALGGSMVPLAVFPPALQFVSRFTPNYWGLQALQQVMMNQPLQWELLLPLVAVGVISLSVASWRIARV